MAASAPCQVSVAFTERRLGLRSFERQMVSAEKVVTLNPEAIVLDFMQPQVAGGQLVGLCGKARRAGRVRCNMWAK
jgi:hypothetical protein